MENVIWKNVFKWRLQIDIILLKSKSGNLCQPSVSIKNEVTLTVITTTMYLFTEL